MNEQEVIPVEVLEKLGTQIGKTTRKWSEKLTGSVEEAAGAVGKALEAGRQTGGRTSPVSDQAARCPHPIHDDENKNKSIDELPSVSHFCAMWSFLESFVSNITPRYLTFWDGVIRIPPRTM